LIHTNIFHNLSTKNKTKINYLPAHGDDSDAFVLDQHPEIYFLSISSVKLMYLGVFLFQSLLYSLYVFSNGGILLNLNKINILAEWRQTDQLSTLFNIRHPGTY
jgi:hypothetical protein